MVIKPAGSTLPIDLKLDKKNMTSIQKKDSFSPEEQKIKSACKDMEAVFLNLLLKEMRKTVQKSSLLGSKSMADDTIQSMLDTEITKNMSNSGRVGLSDMLYKQLNKENKRKDSINNI